MNQIVHTETEDSADIPIWRRVTAFMTLSSLTILGGILIAALLSLMGILMLYGLEGASQ